MKVKELAVAAFAAAAILLTLSQASTTLASEPATPPASSPVTSPELETFTFTGHIRVRLTIKRWVDAQNVLVTLINKKTNATFTTFTNANGDFSVNVPEGRYFVIPTKEGILFSPSWKQKNINRNGLTISFNGKQI